MKLSLVVQNAGKASGQIIPITLAQFTIGRDPQCNLRPGSALISKRHCAILVRQGQVFLRDFDSTNGTFLNDEPVKGEVAVKNEDVLKVGPLQFKVAIEASKVSPAKTAEPQVASAALKPTKVPSETQADDDIAAMLLSLPGEESTDVSTGAGEGDIPSGSTVMDLMVPKEAGGDATAASETTTSQASPTEKKPTPQPASKPDKKNDPAHLAAKAILEKYSRRGRA